MKRIALVFPGQGSQVVGMAKDFCDNFRESRLVFEEGSDVIRFDLSKLCFEGPLAELTLTENLQPALFVAEMAMLAAVRAHADLSVAAFAGHSLGEYGALCAAGSLSLADGVRLTRLRGQAMQRAVPAGEGAMAAVLGLEAETVQGLCREARSASGETVEPANFNGPGQVVISGAAAAVAKAGELAKGSDTYKRAKFIPLQVSAPFHCSLMEPARKEMLEPLRAVSFRAPSAPVIPNLTAQPCEREHEFPALLADQITSAVRWQESMERLPSLLVEEIIEVGPGAVLGGLMKRIDRAMPVKSINSVEILKTLLA